MGVGDIKTALERKITEELADRGYDLVDLSPVPSDGDRMVRLRTLEEMIDEFSYGNDEGTTSYIVQVRKKNLETNTGHSDRVQSGAAVSPGSSRDLYSEDGQVNLKTLESTAQVLISAGDYGLAKNVYQTLLRQGGAISSPKAYLGLGVCAEGEGKLNEAQSHFEESIAYDPTLPAYQRLVALLVRMGRERYAAEVCERALYLRGISDASKFEFHKTCGNCLARLEEVQRSEAHYRAALSIRPDADEIQSNLGSMYLRSGRVADAKRSFQDALASNSGNASAHLGLGCCHMVEGQKKRAHDSFVLALRNRPNDANGIFYLVKCAYEIKEYADAEEIVSKYVQSAPVNPSLLYSLAGLKFHVGKRDEARQVAERILNVRPGHSGAMQLLRMLG